MNIGKEFRCNFELSDEDEERAESKRENSQCYRTHNLQKKTKNFNAKTTFHREKKTTKFENLFINRIGEKYCTCFGIKIVINRRG